MDIKKMAAATDDADEPTRASFEYYFAHDPILRKHLDQAIERDPILRKQLLQARDRAWAFLTEHGRCDQFYEREHYRLDLNFPTVRYTDEH